MRKNIVTPCKTHRSYPAPPPKLRPIIYDSSCAQQFLKWTSTGAPGYSPPSLLTIVSIVKITLFFFSNETLHGCVFPPHHITPSYLIFFPLILFVFHPLPLHLLSLHTCQTPQRRWYSTRFYFFPVTSTTILENKTNAIHPELVQIRAYKLLKK